MAQILSRRETVDSFRAAPPVSLLRAARRLAEDNTGPSRMSASYQPTVWTLARPPISTLPELGVTQAQDAENDRALVDRVQAAYRAARQVYAGSASAWDVPIGEIKRPIRSPSRKAAEAHLTIRQRVRETETRASRDKTALWTRHGKGDPGPQRS
jgi:hypothetical protein